MAAAIGWSIVVHSASMLCVSASKPVAAVIFGGWTLRGTIAGCLLFGVALSFRLSLPALGYQLNGDLLSSLPFVITIVVMTVFASRVRPPNALAQPFIRGLK